VFSCNQRDFQNEEESQRRKQEVPENGAGLGKLRRILRVADR